MKDVKTRELYNNFIVIVYRMLFKNDFYFTKKNKVNSLTIIALKLLIIR